MHVICGLGLPIRKILATRMPELKKFLFGYFVFNQSKNNAVLEPGIGHFLVFVGFETKAKDFKMCPRGQARHRGLHLWLSLKIIKIYNFRGPDVVFEIEHLWNS